MKDIIITSKRIKRELYILLGCFIVATLINIVSIAIFHTSWIEILTQAGYVSAIAIVLYIIIFIIRLTVYFTFKTFGEKTSV